MAAINLYNPVDELMQDYLLFRCREICLISHCYYYTFFKRMKSKAFAIAIGVLMLDRVN